jgi:hypothetical protein
MAPSSHQLTHTTILPHPFLSLNISLSVWKVDVLHVEALRDEAIYSQFRRQQKAQSSVLILVPCIKWQLQGIWGRE